MFKNWLLATRPWSFTAAFVPVGLGCALALAEGQFHWGLALLTLLGGVGLQAGTNLINTWGDFTRGLDTRESAPHLPFLTQGQLQTAHMRWAGIIVFALVALIGVYLVSLRGWPLLALGVVAILAGYTYTAGPAPYKYLGIGSLAVFFLMGPLMTWGAYFVQTGVHSWRPMLASLPVGFLVSAILHANDFRDMESDERAGIRTFALTLGARGSLWFLIFLCSSAFVSLTLLVALRVIPWWAALPLLLLPRLRSYVVRALDGARGDRAKVMRLEPDAGGLHFQFGLLLVAGVAISTWL